MRMITLYTPKIIIISNMKINIQLDISLFAQFEHKAKYIITARIPKLLQKKFYFFSLQSKRMKGKNINFDDKKKKNEFYKKEKSI